MRGSLQIVLYALRMGLSCALFFVFGALCAFVWLAFFAPAAFEAEPLSETSPELRDFLDSNRERIVLDSDGLSKGVGGLVAHCAGTNSFAAPPAVKILDCGEIAVCIPVIYASLMNANARAYSLAFCIDSDFRLARAYFGAARIPLFFARKWAEEMLSHYGRSGRIGEIVASLGSKIKLKIAGNSAYIEKCDLQ